MKKLFNFRPFVFLAIAVVLGILFPILYVASKYYLLLFLLPVVLLSVAVIFKSFRRWLFKNIIFALSVPIIFVLAILSWSVYEVNHKSDGFESGYYTVSGRIKSVQILSDRDFITVVLEDAELSRSELSKKLNKSLTLFINSTESDIFVTENIGDRVEFVGLVRYIPIYEDNQINTKVLYGNSATTSIKNDSFVIEHTEGKSTLAEAAREKIRLLLLDNMDSNTASLNFAMLFGDTSGIDTETRENYSESGIYHLLAVSGLNVGFLALVLAFIMSLVRVPKRFRPIITTIFILLYAILCSFTPSVSRASIMAVVGLYAVYRGRQYDGLNSLAFSLIVILIISPVNIFDIGLYLSFAAVLAIIMLTPPISVFFEKFLTKNIATTISMTLAAQIGTLPILIKYFEQISLYGVFSNVLAVPLASAGFMVLFVSVPLVLAFPFLSFALKVPEYILIAITYVADAFASIKFAVINISYSALAAILYFVAIFIWGDLVFVKQKWSFVIPLILLSVGIVLSVV